MEHGKTNGHARDVGTPKRSRRRGETIPRRPDKPDPYVVYLERQYASLFDALKAARDGDLTIRLPVNETDDVTCRVAGAFNDLVERSETVVREVGRVSRVVGREGRVAERANASGSVGAWAACLESVNAMSGEVAWRTQEVAKIINDVSEGDLSHKMSLEFEGHPLQGDALRIGNTVNQLVDRLRLVSSEVTRVAKEVGTEGKLGGQADVKDVSGTWKDLTDNVNLLAGNLTNQVRNIAQVTTAVANGDLSQKITVDARGEVFELKNTINMMVEQLRAFAAEVTRVAKEVGTEGKLGGQADVKGVSGTWKDLTDNVNLMASNLTSQVRGIVKVVTAVANGDLSQKFVVEAKGEIAALADTMNNMTDTLRVFAEQVVTVAREVGIEGNLGGQAKVPGVSGTWRDLTDNVNMLAGNLTNQVRNIALVTTAVANGDLSQKITVDVRGEVSELKNTINTMVDQLRAFAAEVTRIAKEVGTEGKLGAQADIKGVAGTWKDLTDNVNLLAGNLTSQVRNIALVTTAVANGDLSKKITVDAKGEILELKNTINVMVDQLRAFAAEVTRVAREVGTEGKLGGQAQVPGVAGTWKDLTDNVNFMASNLTNQVRGIVKVVTAVANGNLAQKFVVEAKGEIAALADTINGMTDTLRVFAEQVTTVAREVGTEGKLGGQAKVPGAAGTWRDLTDNVNMLAGNLTNQVRNIAAVTTAVAAGDLSQKITVDAKGEILELKNTINAMVEQLRTFAREVTRVAREVGTEGKLGGQAKVPGVAGTWQDLTDNVNQMASNLTNQVRGIVKVVTAVAEGDLSQKLVVEAKGEIAALADTINNMTSTLRVFADQVTTVAREVGNEGQLGGQARVPGAAGTWQDLTDNVNMLAGNLTSQVRNIAKVTTAIANGDLSQKITVDAKGEILELKDTINATVEQLRTFAAEVTRVAREVGTEGKLGGQAQVPGVAGTWKDLTDNVNLMATNLTDQVRGIVKVVTAVATGDLTKKFIVEAKGEIAALADTINDMTDTLRTFAEQVTTVAREVGIEGQLGGQAKVPGAAGTWKDLTDNVNQLAANLTTQVRAISEVASAVTKGDLTRTIDVGAEGEVLSLKDTINQMIANLKDTTHTNKEQDWLKTNLAKFSQMMQGQRSLESLAQLIMSELTPLVSSQHGTFFVTEVEETNQKPILRLLSSYAFTHRKSLSNRFKLGEGLVGQCALERKTILIDDVPEDYVRISSSVGESTPRNILVLPVLFEGQIKGVIELASFQRFNPIHIVFLEQVMLSIGVVFNMITASMRTEELLEELKGSNVELGKRTNELEEKASLLEEKNREIAQASASLEEKARQLALVSKYKSEFLANMSHELRTPLNSLLILARLLADNNENNLTAKQVDYARTIDSAGNDLLALISQILDLSKIEAGKLEIETSRVALGDVSNFVHTTFAQVAAQKGLEFNVRVSRDAPATITSDVQRVQQILKNLLSNGFKFTEKGVVELRVDRVQGGMRFRSETLNRARGVVAFAVSDTGIGIAEDKQQVIFEAFHQADASTSRMYGGTGLGLTISRELAHLLGGEISVKSEPGGGSIFTLYLPLVSPDLETSYQDGAGEDPHAAWVPELAASAESMVDLAGKKVLLIDDDGRNLFAVTSLLERGGICVVSASSAQDGIDALAEHPDIEVILMDIMLPGMDGYQATHKIRSMYAYATLPIVALTAKAMPGDREKCLDAGCSDFVPKPVDGDQLIAVIKRALAKEELGMSTPIGRHDAKSEGDSAKTNILVVDDYPETIRALEATLSNPSYNVVTASSGAEALKRVLKHDFAVILLDVLMPHMDGFQTASIIRRREISKDVPIIFLTAAGTDLGLIYKAYSVGGVDYLVKPVDPDVVKAKVAVFVDLYRKGQHIRRQERELRAAEQARSDAALRDSEALYEATFNEAPVGIAHATIDGQLTRINRKFCDILGRDASMLGLRLHDIIHADYPEDVAEITVAIHRLLVGEIGTYRTDKRCAHTKGHVVWVSLTVAALRRTNGSPPHLVVIGEDITDRKHAQADQTFLAAASELLLSSLDSRATLLSVARLAVPRLGDWCVIDVTSEQPEGATESIVAHVDPQQAQLLGDARRGLAKDGSSPLAKVLRTGKSEVIAEIPDEMLAANAPDAETLRVLRAVGFRSMVIAPLVVRDRVLGAITLVSSGSRRYGPLDRAIVEEVARRAAFAVDNARLYRQAQEAISAREEFLSIASHELRTPLTPLRVELQRLLGQRTREPLERIPHDRLRAVLMRCDRQAQKLAALIDNLLDVTSLTSGHFKLQLEHVDLGEVTREVIDRFGDELTRSGCDVALCAEGQVHGLWDHLRMDQVVTNLLTNAIKYGSGKPIEISVKMVSDVATLAVRDHGIGIPSERVDRIFGRFERAVSSRAYGGLGLGLYITQQIVDAHGGFVRVESDLGMGSLFTVELPREPDEARLTGSGGCA